MLSGKWVFRHRGVLAHSPLILVLFWRRGEVSNTVLAWGAGLALLFAGMALRIAAIEEGLSMAEALRRAIELWLKERRRARREVKK